MFLFVVIFLFLFGLAFGSFLNAWVYRTRVAQSIAKGRSLCPQCKHQLHWPDLIPVLSFLFLRGKCRYCHKKISLQYPVVEFVTGILFVLVFILQGSNLGVLLFRDLAIVFFLEFIFLYDLLYGEIPFFSTVFPGIALLIFSLFFHFLSPTALILGLCIGTGFFLLQFFISKGAWIGGGDIGMGFFMGVALGSPLIWLALFFAYVGGSLVLLPFLFLKKVNKKSKIPFGTFLAVGTLVTLLWGQKIISFLPL